MQRNSRVVPVREPEPVKPVSGEGEGPDFTSLDDAPIFVPVQIDSESWKPETPGQSIFAMFLGYKPCTGGTKTEGDDSGAYVGAFFLVTRHVPGSYVHTGTETKRALQGDLAFLLPANRLLLSMRGPHYDAQREGAFAEAYRVTYMGRRRVANGAKGETYKAYSVDVDARGPFRLPSSLEPYALTLYDSPDFVGSLREKAKHVPRLSHSTPTVLSLDTTAESVDSDKVGPQGG